MITDTNTATIIEMHLVLREALACRLLASSEKFGRTPVQLMADLIETILRDDLVAAVLDESASAPARNGSAIQ